jgi:hypothetical protein
LVTFPNNISFLMCIPGYTWFGLQFLYDLFIHLSLTIGVFATTQSAVVSVYGPSVALKGAEANVVLMVADKMRQQRKFVLQIGVVNLVCLFFAMLFNFWAKVPPAVCISTTVLYIAGFCICITEGVRCYNIFHPDEEVRLTVRGIKGRWYGNKNFGYYMSSIHLLARISDGCRSLSADVNPRRGKNAAAAVSAREGRGTTADPKARGKDGGSGMSSVGGGKPSQFSPSELGSVVAGGRVGMEGLDDVSRAAMEELATLKQVRVHPDKTHLHTGLLLVD